MNDNDKSQLDGRDDAEMRLVRLTAYALQQLDDAERLEVEQEPSAGERRVVAQIRRLAEAMREPAGSCNETPADSSLRAAVEERLAELEVAPAGGADGVKHGKFSDRERTSRSRGRLWLALSVAGCVLLGALPLGYTVMSYRARVAVSRATASNSLKQIGLATQNYHATSFSESLNAADFEAVDDSKSMRMVEIDQGYSDAQAIASQAPHPGNQQSPSLHDPGRVNTNTHYGDPYALNSNGNGVRNSVRMRQGGYDPRFGDAGLASMGAYGRGYGGMMGGMGGYDGEMMDGANAGYGEMRIRGNVQVQLGKNPSINRLYRSNNNDFGTAGYPGNEQYDPIYENRFLAVDSEPLSTFSIDVDTASYANVRRFLDSGQLPPPAAVRIEELVNYFQYHDPPPRGDAPFAVRLEMAECPWRPEHKLLRVGLKGKEVHREERPASNLVFLLDVSGSMADENKLPLLKSAMKMLAAELGENDRVAIVTYAGEAGLRLDSTRGDKTRKIQSAIDSLTSGGSTNGSAGIELAYEKATENFIQGGVNRVILATDGDLNVGVTDDDALVKLIKRQAKSGVFLTVLGFGTGNLKDSKLEKLADNGNGAYAYIDGLREARRVLVEQISGSLVTIAKDVKIQIEFNPAEVAGYRLIGYENRLLEAPDFDNDKKDAGEIGAGHTVTALYEIVPAGASRMAAGGPSLKYQQPAQPTKGGDRLTAAGESGELLTVFLRYKRPDADESNLLEFALGDRGVRFGQASDDFRFAAAVASFGMLLRNSEYRGNATLAAVEEIAAAAIGDDRQGYRTEFVDLVRKAASIR